LRQSCKRKLIDYSPEKEKAKPKIVLKRKDECIRTTRGENPKEIVQN